MKIGTFRQMSKRAEPGGTGQGSVLLGDLLSLLQNERQREKDTDCIIPWDYHCRRPLRSYAMGNGDRNFSRLIFWTCNCTWRHSRTTGQFLYQLQERKAIREDEECFDNLVPSFVGLPIHLPV